MLLRFQVENFRSFRTEQTLSMVAGSFPDHSEIVHHPAGIHEGVFGRRSDLRCECIG
jgi:hypothetical protein